MDNERVLTASKGSPKGADGRGYHHGDLRNGLLQAAREILEEESLSALTLRAVARKAGVSHAAPYRHFPNHEALLVELSVEALTICARRRRGRQGARRRTTRSPPSAQPICALSSDRAGAFDVRRQLPDRDQFPNGEEDDSAAMRSRGAARFRRGWRSGRRFTAGQWCWKM